MKSLWILGSLGLIANCQTITSWDPVTTYGTNGAECMTDLATITHTVSSEITDTYKVGTYYYGQKLSWTPIAGPAENIYVCHHYSIYNFEVTIDSTGDTVADNYYFGYFEMS